MSFFHFFMEQQHLRETEFTATIHCQEYTKHRGIKDVWVCSTFREKCGIQKNTAFSKIQFLKIYILFQIKFLVVITGSCFSKLREIYFLNYFQSSAKQIINFKRAMVLFLYKPNLLLRAILRLESCTDCKEVRILQCRTNICNWAFNLQRLGT